MFEQFGNYKEIKWSAIVAPQFIGAGGKIQINPDTENFILERFEDSREKLKEKEESTFKLMLFSSKTYIFIDGPDLLLDKIIMRLPKYIGKSWTEIQNMSLERDFLSCDNAFTSVCNQWIIDNVELRPLQPGREMHELDFDKVDEICTNCEHFDPK